MLHGDHLYQFEQDNRSPLTGVATYYLVPILTPRFDQHSSIPPLWRRWDTWN